MNKKFEVKYDDAKGERFTNDFPTREEAETFAEEMFEAGYAVVPKIFEIRI